jgi:hypothetical protein
VRLRLPEDELEELAVCGAVGVNTAEIGMRVLGARSVRGCSESAAGVVTGVVAACRAGGTGCAMKGADGPAMPPAASATALAFSCA